MGCGCGTKVRTNATKQIDKISNNTSRVSQRYATSLRRKVIRRPAR